MKKRWRGLLAALLAAMMLAGCSSSDLATATEIAETALSIAEEVSAADTEAVADAEVAADAEDAAASVTYTEEEEAAVAASTDADAVDPDFAIDGEEENAALVTGPGPQVSTETIAEDGYYYDKDNVALYLVTYHKLPGNYITKKEAKKLGWEGGPLEPYAHDMAIGGDYFGNYEGTLPEDVEYHECDIDTKGKKRGAKRIIYSENWDIYYTDDHYETFTLLYEGE